MSDLEEVAKIEENENDVIQQPSKKPRTEKQIAATKKMLEAREMKRKEMEELKQIRELKRAEEEEKMRKKVEDKIVKKAINIKKKNVTKKEILERILDESDSEPDSQPEKIERKRPIAKKVKADTKEPMKKDDRLASSIKQVVASHFQSMPVSQTKFIYLK